MEMYIQSQGDLEAIHQVIFLSLTILPPVGPEISPRAILGLYLVFENNHKTANRLN